MGKSNFGSGSFENGILGRGDFWNMGSREKEFLGKKYVGALEKLDFGRIRFWKMRFWKMGSWKKILDFGS